VVIELESLVVCGQNCFPTWEWVRNGTHMFRGGYLPLDRAARPGYLIGLRQSCSFTSASFTSASSTLANSLATGLYYSPQSKMTSNYFTEEHLRLSTNIENLTSTLNYQQQIQAHGTIPISHQPRTLRTPDPAITREFEEDYRKLFFTYLDKAITNNSIQLELHKAALAAITSPTPQQDNTEQHCDTLTYNYTDNTTKTQSKNIYRRGRRGQKRKHSPTDMTTTSRQNIFYPKAPYHPNHQLDNTQPDNTQL
jgi:hypothetical protein